ncbi:MAG TPA: hypothetical protein VNJ04_17855 [Gemmatimonadaceae bacterium]|nr:hypothetical protein [Gemmatimonadaceae bacterium]
MPHVALLERRASSRRKDPQRHLLTLLQPHLALLPAPIEQRRGELRGHVDAPPLV